jgi:hypothetical protein
MLEVRLLPSNVAPLVSTSSGALTLTNVASVSGFQLTTFASGFAPRSDGLGPTGFGFPASGGVLVTDGIANVRLFPNDNDGQSAGSVPVTPGAPAADGPCGIAELNGQLYMTLQNAGEVVQVNDSGIVQTVVARGIPLATGITPNPLTGHLFVSSSSGIYDVDPVAQTATVVLDQQADGVAFDPSTQTLYAALSNSVVGYSVLSKAQVFDSGTIAGHPDGIAVGAGALVGSLVVNTNGGTLILISRSTRTEVVIASGGTRGDFVTVDPTNGTLLVSQSDRIARLIPPSNSRFGGNPTPTPTTPTPTPSPTASSAFVLTSVQQQSVAVGTGRKARKVTALVLYFSAPLNTSAAENLAAYSLLPGKVKRRVTTFINKPVPMSSANYTPGATTVTLLPRNTSRLARIMELQVTSALLTDTLGRPLDNGHNYVVTVSRSGSTIRSLDLVASPAPRAAPGIAPRRVSATQFVPRGPAAV